MSSISYLSFAAPSVTDAGRPLLHNVWAYPEILLRLTLGLALGLLIGLERERRYKEAGLRTFGFVALVGAISGAQGENFALAALLLTGVMIVFLNLQSLRADQGTELTTSAALLVTCFAGILCGQGQALTPAAIIVMTTALLAWKQPMAGFSMGLTENELRSALILAVLAIVIYPALPDQAIGPHQLIVPRQAWLTVLLIAGIGFVNYVLWKIYGTRGVDLAAFLGGLVNSRIAIVDLAGRVGETQGRSADAAYRGILFATAAMLIRNALVLGILAPAALLAVGGAFAAMLAVCGFFALFTLQRGMAASADPSLARFQLTLPFSLGAALKYGALFVSIQMAGNLAQLAAGEGAFYLVSMLGGLASSASSLAAAANLAANGTLPPETAGMGAVIATLTSVLINIPFVIRSRHPALTRRLLVAFTIVVAVGVIGALAGPLSPPAWLSEFLFQVR
jgi:uncharacterized membrane protein (DUF4010 family)